MPPPEPVITIQDLVFRWRADGPVILSISALAVSAGERLFLQGPSGSGKSTLLALLGGVVTPQQGRIEVLGHDLGRMKPAARDHFRADHVGFVFQLHNLLPFLSVLDNVLLPCRFSKRRHAAAIARAGSLEAAAKRLLAHLDLADPALLARPVTELSVGQQQRVAAARALIGAPALPIADEPTSALDADRRTAFLDLLMRECRDQGSTLLFVSHDGALRPLFDRAVDLPALNRQGQDSDRQDAKNAKGAQ